MTQGFDGRRLSRRRLLGVGGAALAAASAGCSGLPPLGGRINFGSIDGPDPGSPTYRQWLPAPSAVPDGSGFEDGYVLWYGEPSQFATLDADRPVDQVRDFLAPRADYVGVGFDAYDRVLLTGPVLVLEGDLDPGAVAETVTDSGYEPTESYADYDLFERDDLPRAVAVREDTVLLGRGDAPRADVELVADAGAGEVARYHEADENAATITDATGAYPWIMYQGLAADGVRADEYDVLASSYGTAFDDEHFYFVLTRAYADADAVDRGALEAELGAGGVARQYDSWAVDVTVDGRIARAVGQVSLDEALDQRDADEQMPQVTWGFEEGEGALTIRHEAGETVDARIPTLYWDGTGDADPPDAQFADEYERVAPGDALTVDVGDLPPGAELRLVYDLPSGSASATAHEYEVNA